MSQDYIEPQNSQNHSSVARITKVPRRERRSKSVGRSFWSSLMKPFSYGEPSDHSSLAAKSKRSSSPSTTSHRSQDLDSTADEHSINHNSFSRPSRASTTSPISSRPSPLPRKTSLMKSHISDCDSRSVTSRNSQIDDQFSLNRTDSFRSTISRQGSHTSCHDGSDETKQPKSKTTIVVHLRKNSKTNSTISNPEGLSTANSIPHERFIVDNRGQHETPSNGWNRRNGVVRNQKSKQSLRPDFDHLNPKFQSRESRTRIETQDFAPKRNRSFEDVHRGIPFEYPENRESSRDFTKGRDKPSATAFERNSKSNFDKRMFKSHQDLIELNQNRITSNNGKREGEKINLELNSLQVFRQPKYRNRSKSERKIVHLQHLERNGNCREVVRELGHTFHPRVYENMNSLSIFQEEMKSGFITSSRHSLTANDRNQSNWRIKSESRINPMNEPIYAEIDESAAPSESPFPSVHKRVSFITNHQPFIENDIFNFNKKVLPATLWGIVEVKCALRDRRDPDRRSVAKLCYHAIKSAAPDHSIKVLGKIDRSRFGESVYVVLEEGNFEIRDGEGLVVAKHKPTDISVIREIEEDPNLFVYIGRCKFGGRISMVLRFNKQRHLGIIIDFFR